MLSASQRVVISVAIILGIIALTAIIVTTRQSGYDRDVQKAIDQGMDPVVARCVYDRDAFNTALCIGVGPRTQTN